MVVQSAAQKNAAKLQTPWTLKAQHYLGDEYYSTTDTEKELVIDENSLKHRIYLLFEDSNSSPLALLIGLVISVMIIFSTVTFVVETIPSVQRNTSETMWFIMELVCITAFCIDFIVRAVCAPDQKTFWSPSKSPMNWVDLIAILPFFMELFVKGVFGEETAESLGLSNLRIIRVVRLAKIVQTYSIWKYKEDLSGVIVNIIIKAGPALAVPLYFMALALVVFASLAYFAEEREAHACGTGCKEETNDDCDPWTDGNVVGQYDTGACCYCYRGQEYSSDFFPDIPTGFWWAFVTMTTVGYGEIYCRSWIGRGVSVLTTVTGIFFMAMPLTIVGSTFNQTWDQTQRNLRKKMRKITREEQPAEHKDLLRKFYLVADLVAELRTAVEDLEAEESNDLSSLQEGVTQAIAQHDPIAVEIKEIFEVDKENKVKVARVLESWTGKKFLVDEEPEEQTQAQSLWRNAAMKARLSNATTNQS